jgi:hypothetical protein
MTFYTIGVYASTEHEFFQKIIDNEIDTFCDVTGLKSLNELLQVWTFYFTWSGVLGRTWV